MAQTKQVLVLLLLMTWESWKTLTETGIWSLAVFLSLKSRIKEQVKQDGLRNLFFKTGAKEEAEKEEMKIHAFG